MILYIATATIAAVVQGAQQISNYTSIQGFELRNVKFIAALTFETELTKAEVELRFQKISEQENNYSFRLYRFCARDWTLHCQGSVQVDYWGEHEHIFMETKTEKFQIAEANFCAISRAQSYSPESNSLYRMLANLSYQYGPSFQLLQDVCCNNNGQAAALVKPCSNDQTEQPSIQQSHIVHPAALDAVFQLALVGATDSGQASMSTIVPSSIKTIWLSSSGLTLPQTTATQITANTTLSDGNSLAASATAFSRERNEVLVELRGLQGLAVTGGSIDMPYSGPDYSHLCFNMVRKPDVELMSTSQILAYCWDGEKRKDFAGRKMRFHVCGERYCHDSVAQR